jgi:hypothetical protein
MDTTDQLNMTGHMANPNADGMDKRESHGFALTAATK